MIAGAEIKIHKKKDLANCALWGIYEKTIPAKKVDDCASSTQLCIVADLWVLPNSREFTFGSGCRGASTGDRLRWFQRRLTFALPLCATWIRLGLSHGGDGEEILVGQQPGAGIECLLPLRCTAQLFSHPLALLLPSLSICPKRSDVVRHLTTQGSTSLRHGGHQRGLLAAGFGTARRRRRGRPFGSRGPAPAASAGAPFGGHVGAGVAGGMGKGGGSSEAKGASKSSLLVL